jgi:hypothetical protein
MSKVTNYSLIVDGIEYPLYVVGNMSFGGTQSLVIYESVGTNGGAVIATGRTNNSITLNGKLLRYGDLSLNDIKAQIQNIRDGGRPVTLVAPIDNNDTGRYIIQEFTGNVIEGTPGYLSFTLILQEYRQVNVKRALVNLVSFEPAEQFRDILRQREGLENE